MPTPRMARCPFCGRSYPLDDAGSPIQRAGNARVPADGHVQPAAPAPKISLVWPVAATVAAAAASSLLLATHKSVVGVVAFAYLVAVTWRAWIRSRRTRR